MRDPRLERLAANLLDYSLELKAGEKLLIESDIAARDLIIALVEAAYERGALPFFQVGDARIRRAWYLNAEARADGSRDRLGVAPDGRHRRHPLHLGRGQRLGDGRRAAGRSGDLPPGRRAPHGEVPHQEMVPRSASPPRRPPRRPGCRPRPSRTSVWTCPLSTTPAWTRPWTRWWSSCPAPTGCASSSPGTDLSFSIKGIPVLKAAGKNNIPDGEVFTAPVRDSANGTILYNTPSLEDGTTYERVRFTFKDGKIVDCRRQRAREAASRCSIPTRAPVTWASSPWG